MRSVKSMIDLVTNLEDTKSGFLWQAQEKSRRSKDYYALADYFLAQVRAGKITSIRDVHADVKIERFMVAACMISEKSMKYVSIQEQISELIDFQQLNASPIYVDDLLRRYFLTFGDSLGGTMRNVVGGVGQTKLDEAIFSRLTHLGMNPVRLMNGPKTKAVAIVWLDRVVIFDKKPKFINNSVDIIVIRKSPTEIISNPGHLTELIERVDDYVCAGELKSGIDPAGADEHWKTAKTALSRISTIFTSLGKQQPKLVFLGAAIESSMAREIFSLLDSGWLAGAANLNHPDQFDEIVDIIIS